MDVEVLTCSNTLLSVPGAGYKVGSSCPHTLKCPFKYAVENEILKQQKCTKLFKRDSSTIRQKVSLVCVEQKDIKGYVCNQKADL